jgi:hypothetical protein
LKLATKCFVPQLAGLKALERACSHRKNRKASEKAAVMLFVE